MDASLFTLAEGNNFDQMFHWRRILDLISDETVLNEQGIAVAPEPHDIKPGGLSNHGFISALAVLCERPSLVERLFSSKKLNAMGLYRVKICKNGEW